MVDREPRLELINLVNRQEIELLAMRKKMGGAGPPRDARGFIGTGGAGRGNGGLQTMHIPKGALDAGMMNTAPVPEGFGKGRVMVDGATADVRRAQMQAVSLSTVFFFRRERL